MSAWLTRVTGGPARRYVVVVLACVLGLDSADSATVGAVAAPLEGSLHIGTTAVGLLVSVTAFAGAAGTLPFGFLIDRSRRTRVLAAAIVCWSATMILGALAPSFTMLLITRIALGVVVAAASPAVASLTGDYFPAAERGRIYGLILSGELLGAGLGYIISGQVAGVLSWRAAFGVLSVPGLVLAWIVWRRLPEPVRGGGGQLPAGATDLNAAVNDTAAAASASPGPAAPFAERGESVAEQAIRDSDINASDGYVLKADPAELSLTAAIRYVLRVRTNAALIIASSLGYFYFSGLRAFALLFIRGHFGLGQAAASALVPIIGSGAILGVITGGRLADQLTRRGHLGARIAVPAVAFTAAVVIFIPGLAASSLLLALPLFTLGAGMLGAANPPLDAARLDIIPPGLWGRAEAIRTLLRTLAQGVAPLLVGILSDEFARSATHGSPTGLGGFTPATAAAVGHGLQYTLLITLTTLLAAGLLLLRARHTYPADVAAALATHDHHQPPTTSH